MQSTATDVQHRELCINFLHMNRTDREKVQRQDRRYVPMAILCGISIEDTAIALGLPIETVEAILAGEQ